MIRTLFATVLTIALASPAAGWDPGLIIDSVTPSVAHPAGGQMVWIRGHGFGTPTRVYFVLDDQELEALAVDAGDSDLRVLTPAVAMRAGEQYRVAQIRVETRGFRMTAREAFLFESAILHPAITGASPNRGSVAGGTRVSVYGEGFQSPVRVWFGELEARVLDVARTHVEVESPARAETATVGITLRNVGSRSEVTLAEAFHYTRNVTITGVTPDRGPAGTSVTIFGEGFRAPVAVTVGGIPAQPLMVSETKIIARTQAAPTCGPFTGSVFVTNLDDQGYAFGPAFTHDATPVEIVAVNPRVAIAGRTVDVQVGHEGDYAFAIGGIRAEIVARHRTTYRLRIPTTLPFPTGACTFRGIGGTGPVESRFSVHALDRRGNCATTRRTALTVAPPAPVACTLPPLASVLTRSCSSRTVTIANERDRADLVITAPASVSPRVATIRGGETTRFVLPTTTRLERLRFETNDPRQPWLSVCVSP